MSEGGKSPEPKLRTSGSEDQVIKFSGWGLRQLARVIVRYRFGFLVVVLAFFGFVAAGIGVAEYLPVNRATGRATTYLFVGAWLCIGLLLALARHVLRKPEPEWARLNATRRAFRLLLTLVGTFVFTLPFGFVLWLIFRR